MLFLCAFSKKLCFFLFRLYIALEANLKRNATKRRDFLIEAEPCSESLGDGVSTRRLSEDTRSGLTRNEVKNGDIFAFEKLFCKETLGNPCIKWLPMLYYEG